MHGTTLRATLTTLSELNCPAAVEAVLIEVTGVSMSVRMECMARLVRFGEEISLEAQVFILL